MLDRRTFVKRISQAAVALGAAGTLDMKTSADQAEDSRLLPIIDTHQHLWDLQKFNVPWLDEAPAILDRSYVTEDYLQATEGLNVVKAVYMEINADPAQQVAEAEHVFGLCQSDEHPTVAAVISGPLHSEQFSDYVARFRDTPYFKGVRQVLHVPETPRGLCLEDQFVQSVQLLGELGKSFDLCMRPTELGDGVKLVDRCPDTQFIIDHCGNADPKAFLDRAGEAPWHEAEQWRRDMSELARRENVVCKISGIVARAPQGDWTSDILAPIINHCLDQFGPDRVVFGGDWPVCLLGASYRRWVEALKEVISDRAEQEQRKLLHDNAVRIYTLAN